MECIIEKHKCKVIISETCMAPTSTYRYSRQGKNDTTGVDAAATSRYLQRCRAIRCGCSLGPRARVTHAELGRSIAGNGCRRTVASVLDSTVHAAIILSCFHKRKRERERERERERGKGKGLFHFMWLFSSRACATRQSRRVGDSPLRWKIPHGPPACSLFHAARIARRSLKPSRFPTTCSRAHNQLCIRLC